MNSLKAIFLGVTLLALPDSPVAAHFNMLLPEKPSAKRGEAITIVYQWGHPFEHQLFDAALPKKLIVRTPDGHSRLELSRFLAPPVVADHRVAPVNALGYLRVMFTVVDIDDTLVRLRKRGAKLVGHRESGAPRSGPEKLGRSH